jgi:lipoate-protein ligase A
VGNSPRGLYELAHAAVIDTLAGLGVAASRSGFSDDSGAARGPFFCFARRHESDLLLGDQKITGSAQRRTKHAILQHGSIVLATRFAQHPTATLDLPLATTVEKVRLFFPAHFSQRIKTPCQAGDWSAAELALASKLREKYAGNEWTRRM